MSASCLDCGLDYTEFPLDTILSDADWLRIHPEGLNGLLCAGCIATRVAKLPHAIVISARIIFSEEHKEWARSVRVERAAPELLAVAVEAEDWFDNHGDPDDPGAMGLLQMFRAAIAKTEGRL